MRPAGRRRRLRVLPFVAIAAVVTAALVTQPGGERRRDAATGPIAVELTVTGMHDVRRVPRSFLGLSTEYWTLPIYERYPKLFRRVLSLLRVRGGGPVILRIGGDSADHARWLPARGASIPPWVLRLSPATLARLARLVRGSDLRLILDLNVATGSARGALALARAAEAALPARSIIGLEIGNEPDVLDRSFFVGALANRDPLVELGRPQRVWIYLRAYARDARLLRRLTPHAGLIGLALANPVRHRAWISALLAAPHPGLRAVSAHFYPFSGCAQHDSPAYPTVTRLLTETTLPGWSRRIAAAARAAHRAHLAFRMTELNSVACGGVAGVSDSFATALWAPDVLFGLVRAGVSSVNVHVRAYPVNAAFAISRGRLVPRPLLYGLILFAQTLGPGATLIPLRRDVQAGANVSAWAVRLRANLLHVLVLVKEPRAVNLRLRLPRAGRATVERLLAPEVTAARGVTLAGRHLGPGGHWRGSRVVTTVARVGGSYRLRLPGMSAALVSVRLKL